MSVLLTEYYPRVEGNYYSLRLGNDILILEVFRLRMEVVVVIPNNVIPKLGVIVVKPKQSSKKIRGCR